MWFNNPLELFRTDRITKFWPTGQQTTSERINATTRFVIYASCILYVITRDVRIFMLGGILLGILYVMWISDMVPNDFVALYGKSRCRDPTYNNPMGNPLIGEDPSLPGPCWYPSVETRVNEFQMLDRSARRNFYSIPTNDIESMKLALNPNIYGPNCRDDGVCYDFRNPEHVQMRTFG